VSGLQRSCGYLAASYLGILRRFVAVLPSVIVTIACGTEESAADRVSCDSTGDDVFFAVAVPPPYPGCLEGAPARRAYEQLTRIRVGQPRREAASVRWVRRNGG
jgi:hypothetical protein